MRTKHLPVLMLSFAFGIAGCGSDEGTTEVGGDVAGNTGSSQTGGTTAKASSSDSVPTSSGGSEGGKSSTTPSAGGSSATNPGGGASSQPPSSTGKGGQGGTSAKGGTTSSKTSAGDSSGGRSSRAGRTAGAGGTSTASGGTNTGGSSSGTSTTPSTGPIDCDAAMPTSGGTQHCGSYRTGKAGTQNWELWSNQYNGNACITYYSTPAFSAKWSNNNDFLARVGIEWGGKTIANLGTITADFTVKKSGTYGGYSYIGIYGWATQPCTEYYIIDDSMKGMPFSPWNMQQKGSAVIDGETYKFYSGQFGGTGGSRCTTPFTQNWSIRQKARSCGTITISKHFEEWKKVGMGIDNILEAKVLVESGGGTGSVEFPIASVKAVK